MHSKAQCLHLKPLHMESQIMRMIIIAIPRTTNFTFMFSNHIFRWIVLPCLWKLSAWRATFLSPFNQPFSSPFTLQWYIYIYIYIAKEHNVHTHICKSIHTNRYMHIMYVCLDSAYMDTNIIYIHACMHACVFRIIMHVQYKSATYLISKVFSLVYQ